MVSALPLPSPYPPIQVSLLQQSRSGLRSLRSAPDHRHRQRPALHREPPHQVLPLRLPVSTNCFFFCSPIVFASLSRVYLTCGQFVHKFILCRKSAVSRRDSVYGVSLLERSGLVLIVTGSERMPLPYLHRGLHRAPVRFRRSAVPVRVRNNTRFRKEDLPAVPGSCSPRVPSV